MIKVLQTLKYYDPYKGGVESVAKGLVEEMSKACGNINFTVYCNNHVSSNKSIISFSNQLKVFRESSLLFLKSQPLNILYKNLPSLIMDHDVIHHHYPCPTLEWALLRNLEHIKNKKLLITWHANIQNSRWSWIRRFYNPMIKKLLKQADYIVVTSLQLFHESEILKEFEDKIRVIPLAYNPKFEIKKGRELSNRTKKILFVGKFREYKGLPYLIEAMKNIDAHLDIVGNGEKERNLKEQVDRLCLGNRIKFHANTCERDLIEFYKKADLFILPSISEAEAFGIVQLEALSAGIPVINTSLKSGVPHVSIDGVTGITVPPKNVVEIANAANKILSSPDLYKTYSNNALQRAKLFSAEAMISQYYNLYI